MTANDSKSSLPYLNKLVDQYNNTHHYSIGKKTVNADYYVLTEKSETNPKAPKFKVDDRESELLSIKLFLAKVTLKIGQEKYLFSILF